MKLTTKGRYAVTAMLDVAIHEESGPVCLSDISRRQDISLSYLEQLFSKLRRSNLVDSVRGPGGGYQLSAKSSAIDISKIIDAVSEEINVTNCGGKGNCQNGEMCLTHHLWEDLTEQLHQFLSGITLANLIERRDIHAISQRQDTVEQKLLEVI